MIRWILDRKWLSISLYASMFTLLSAGFELINQNYLGLSFSISLGVSVLASRRFPYLSAAILPLAAWLLSAYSAVPILSIAAIATVFLFLGLFSNTFSIVWGVFSALVSSAVLAYNLGYQGQLLHLLVGANLTTELNRVNALLILFTVFVSFLVLALASGRLLFIRLEHIGSPKDQAYSSIRAGKLRLEVAKQNERLEIAKDLSEMLVQRISAVVSVTEGGKYALATDPKVAYRVLERAHEAGRSAQAELRRLYDYLHSAIIADAESFRISDLDELAVAYRELGFNTIVSHQGQSFSLNEGMELCVYKIVFESLKNVRKHAPLGTEISVDFLWVEDGLQILVKDNGIEVSNRAKQALGQIIEGYEASEDLESLISEFDGATLAALRDRAAIYKGRIEATKVPGVGFTLSAIFPNLKSLAVLEG